MPRFLQGSAWEGSGLRGSQSLGVLGKLKKRISYEYSKTNGGARKDV